MHAVDDGGTALVVPQWRRFEVVPIACPLLCLIKSLGADGQQPVVAVCGIAPVAAAVAIASIVQMASIVPAF